MAAWGFIVTIMFPPLYSKYNDFITYFWNKTNINKCDRVNILSNYYKYFNPY